MPKEQAKYVVFMRLEDQEAHYDPIAWPNRTMETAHEYVRSNFDALESGAVVDVEHILGLSEKPKVSERLASLRAK